MKRLAAFLIILAALALAPFEHAVARLPNVAGISGCPSPTTEGSIIRPNTSCQLVEVGGNLWSYLNTGTLNQSNNGGTSWTSVTSAPLGAQRNNSGHIYWSQPFPPNSVPNWFRNGGFITQEISPTATPQGSIFLDVTTGLGYVSISHLLHNVAPGNTVTIPANPSGITAWSSAYQIGVSNLTVNIAAGAAMCCTQASGNAFWVLDVPSNVDGFTLNFGSGTSLGYIHDPSGGQYRGVNMANGTNWTLAGTGASPGLIHHADFGLQGLAQRTGSAHVTNMWFDSNGAQNNASSTHGVYLNYGTDPLAISPVTFSRGGSSCPIDDSHPGFPYKLRWASGSLDHLYALGEPSIIGTPIIQCQHSAAIDLSCGGVWSFSHIVAEIGQGAINQGIQAIRFGAEAAGTNCPNVGPGGIGWATNSLTIDHSLILLDVVGDTHGGPFAIQNTHGLPNPTIGTSIIVDNGAGVRSLATALGVNVTDLGTNTYYPDRATAAAALGWPSTDAFGNPCCADPYIPPIP